MPTILILGASRGLGLGLAGEFARRGWQVIAAARDPSRAPRLRSLANASYGKIEVEKTDITDLNDVEGLHERLAGRPLDVLFVNAAYYGTHGKTLREYTKEETAEVYYTNVVSTVRAADVLQDRVRGETGVIAFMTSGLGSLSLMIPGRGPEEDLYRASKAGMNLLIRLLTARLKNPSQTVITLNPGWVRTDMGGPNAFLDIDTSVRGLADVVERARGSHQHGFFNYEGKELPW